MSVHDFAARARRPRQTLRDRRALRSAADRPLSESEHQRRMLRTEYVGGYLMCLTHVVLLLLFFLVLWLWVDAGGAL